MRHALPLLLLCAAAHAAKVAQFRAEDFAAATTFVIGNEPFELEFETNPTNEVFRAFVAADVSRVFAPLGNISNVVDIASLQQHPEMSRGLTFREWYPCVSFPSRGFSTVNDGCSSIRQQLITRLRK